MPRLLITFVSRRVPLLGVALFVPAGLGLSYIALDPTGEATASAGLAAAWIIAAIASYWALDELLREETESGAVEQYVVAGREERLYWEWVVAGALLTLLVWFLSLLVAILFFGLIVLDWQPLVWSGLVYAIGAGSILSFARILGAHAGGGALLGPLVGFPLQIPVLLAGVQYSRAAVMHVPADFKWMLLGLFFGILYLLLGQWSTPLLIKE